MKSLKRNVIYNSIYQFLIMFLPFITAPYLSRVIGANGVGTYSYSYSVAQYFIYIAMLGLTNYGNRSIAAVNDDRGKKSKVFSEIYCMQISTALLSMVLYGIYSFFAKDKAVSLIMSLYVLSSLFDINWLFFGTENFKITVTRNTIIKILSVFAIFVFVRSASDTYTYILIMALSTLISQLALWPFVKKEVDLCLPKWNNIKKHYKPNLMLFVPVIAVSIYKVMDKIMLGMMSSTTNVGYYEYAEKIYNIPLLLVTAVGTVMLPRMTYYYSNGKINEAKKYFSLSMEYILAFSNAAMFGLLAIANDFVVLYYGKDFIQSAIIICYLSLTIVFLAAGNVIRTQFLIPKRLDKIYIRSAIYGATINFIVNFSLIPILGTVGAAIGTIVAEAVVFFYQVFSIRKLLNVKEIFFIEIPYLFIGLFMFVIINWINIKSILFSLLAKICIGALICLIGFGIVFYKKYKQIPIVNLIKNKSRK